MSPRHFRLYIAASATSLTLLAFVVAGTSPSPSAQLAGGDRAGSADHHASVDGFPRDRDGSNGASVVNAGWILLAIGTVGAVVWLATSWARRDHYADLGTVSHHWIAEQRLGRGQNPQR